jgi:tRNA(Ile2) C34 agmatinyltransferase TiaS
MSAYWEVPTCPSCGGDRTSDENNGEFYCVECNRTFHVTKSDAGPGEHAQPAPAPETVPKAA